MSPATISRYRLLAHLIRLHGLTAKIRDVHAAHRKAHRAVLDPGHWHNPRGAGQDTVPAFRS